MRLQRPSLATTNPSNEDCSSVSLVINEVVLEGRFSGYRPRLLLASAYAASVIASAVERRYVYLREDLLEWIRGR